MMRNKKKFKSYEFFDWYKAPCCIQETSMRFIHDGIWIGGLRGDLGIFLSKKHAKMLVKHLQKFIKSGRL